MARRKRYFKRKEDCIRGTKYDSLLEKRLHETSLKDARFHAKEDLVQYVVSHTYEPDFVIEREGKRYIIESKGRFRDSDEARKYLFIREHLKENEELVFIFEKASTAFPFAKRRKDGTKRTHGEWADKNKFRWWEPLSFKVDYL